jgi:Ca-activated chloride channel family protein
MTRILRCIVASLLFACVGVVFMGPAAHAADRVIVILDASGSMWAQIDGRPKLEIARESLRTALQSVPGDEEIGFMAYGHREKGSCSDIELIVPPATGTAGQITTAADNLKFLGKTPLTAAVKQAAEALKYTEDKAKVILITDGLETCGGDPCALGKELKANGIDFTADVVGFGLTAEEGRQVACLAENTGGKYIQASDEAALKEALAETVAAPAPAPEPQPAPAPEPAKPAFNFEPTVIMAEGGDAVTDGNAWEIYKAQADGSAGENVTTEYGAYKGSLDPGDYVVRATLGEARTEQKVTIAADKVAKPVFVLNAGRLVLHPRPAEGAEIADGASLVFKYPGGETTEYGDAKVVLPAGDIEVTTRIGNGTATETIKLAAGQTVEKDVIVGVGHVVVNAFYTAGGDKADSSGISFEVFKAKKKIDGTRESVEHNYGPDSKFDLPAGDYVVEAKLELATAEQPFTVKVGEAQEVNVAMNAGVLAISAPGAKFIEIFGAKKDINGNRKSLGYAYDEKYQAALPAGDYAIVAHRGDDDKLSEAAATVKAGERSEVTVP